MLIKLYMIFSVLGRVQARFLNQEGKSLGERGQDACRGESVQAGGAACCIDTEKGSKLEQLAALNGVTIKTLL